MKRKLLNWGGVLLTMALLFTSCHNAINADVSNGGNGTGSRTGTYANLTIGLTQDSFNIVRNILPADWTDGNSDLTDDKAYNLKYVLTGYTIKSTTDTGTGGTAISTSDKPAAGYVAYSNESKYYKEFSYSELMAKDTADDKATISLKPLVWRFKLTAYQTAIKDDDTDGYPDNTDICLEGWANIDMTDASKNSITFSLAAPTQGATDTKATDATGEVKLKLSFNPPETFTRVTYGVYSGDVTSGTPDFSTAVLDAAATPASTEITLAKVDGDNPTVDMPSLQKATVTTIGQNTTVTPDGTDVVTAQSNTGSKGFLHSFKDIPINYTLYGGTYWFRAVFYDTNQKRSTVYVEKLIVDGANESAKDITLLESVFNSSPQNIKDLKLSYKFNNTEFSSTPGYAANYTYKDGDSQDTDKKALYTTYDATFSWTDVADNETGYKVKLYVDDSSTPVELNNIDASETGGMSTANATKYGVTTADFNPGKTSFTLKLETGVKYKIEIKAYNSWSNDTATTTTEGYDTYIKYTPRSSAETDADNESFGLFTIDYNLNKGYIQQTGSVKTTSDITHYIVPYIYMADDNKLIGTSETPYLNRAKFNFVGWNELYGDPEVALRTNPSTVNNSKNFFTSPNYTGSGTGTNTDSTKVTTFVNNGPERTAMITDSTFTLEDGTTKRATYAYTLTVWSDDDGETFVNDNSGAPGSDAVAVPINAIVTKTETTSGGYTKYFFSNLLKEDGSIEPDNIKNRELFASWETDLKINIKVPNYSDSNVKLSKQANTGDALEYAAGSTIVVNASDKLTDVEFHIYKDDITSTDPFSSEVTGTKVTVSDTGEDKNGGTLTWETVKGTDAAEVYYVKISGVYTYADDTTNSLSGTTTTVEGYIYIKLTN